MNSPIYLIDRSRIDTREDCERKRYLNYDYPVDDVPTGVQRTSQALPLLNGIEIHEAHAKILAGQDLDAVVGEMHERYRDQVAARPIYTAEPTDAKQLVTEQTHLLEAMLRMFKRVWVPRILDEYDIVCIEKPMDWQLAPGLVQKLRFDVVLRRKGDGQLVILDYKTMAYISDAWAKKLERSRQTSLYISAAQELFGEAVEMAYVGIVKGAYRKDTAKSSPFFGQKIQASAYLYTYAFDGPLGTVYQTEYTAKKGYQKVRTYDRMSIKEWTDWLWANEKNTVNELFTFNPPFAPTPRELTRVKELVVREELAYLEKVKRYHEMRRRAQGDERLLQQAQDYLDYIAAPLRESRCFQYGADSVCAFYDICFNDGAFDRVLEDGGFEPREAHHNTRLEEVA